MKHEYEAKFLNVNEEELRERVIKLGGRQIHPRRLFTRYVFESEELQKNKAWLRVRSEDGNVTMTLKRSLGTNDIEGVQEIEVGVSNMNDIIDMLKFFGLKQRRYQENYREKWKLGNIVLDIDTWPEIPTYVEVEGPTKESVESASKKLGFDYKNAKFGSVDEIYLNEYGIDILSMDKLLFKDSSNKSSNKES